MPASLVRLVLIIVLLIPFFLFAQDQKSTLLIIPLSPEKIHFNSLTESNVKYNNGNIDSLKSFIVNKINEECRATFNNYHVHFLKEYFSSDNLPDSSYELKLWNCFYYDWKDSSLKNFNVSGMSMNSYHSKYYGFNFINNGLEIIKQAVIASKCNYVFIIDKFEIINPNSIFSLHCEIFDHSLNRVYRNKNELKRSISKTMYMDVLKYYVIYSSKEMLYEVSKFLR
ncbi:MAG: hypothetical protein ACHQNT_07040 [Bacteroidia bacterium]